MKTLDWGQYNMTPLSEDLCKELSTEDVTVVAGWIGDKPDSVYFGKMHFVAKLAEPVYNTRAYIFVTDTRFFRQDELIKVGGYPAWPAGFDWIQCEFNIYDPDFPGNRFTNKMHEAVLSIHIGDTDFLERNENKINWGAGIMIGDPTDKLTEEQQQRRAFDRHTAEVSRRHNFAKIIKDQVPAHEKWMEEHPDEWGKCYLDNVDIPSLENWSL